MQDCIAKALSEESLVANEHIGRTQFARFQLADETFGLGEGAHLVSSCESRVGSGCYARLAFGTG